MKKKINIYQILVFFLLVTSFLYVVSNNLPSPFGSFRWLYAPLWIVTLFFLNPKVLFEKRVLMLFLFAVLMILVLGNTLWVHMSEWYQDKINEDFYALFIAFTISTYFIVSKDFNGWARLSAWAIIFIFVTCIMTVIATAIEPSIARNSVNSFKYYPNQRVLFDITGTGGYGFGQALVLLLPVLIYYLKSNIKSLFSTIFIILSIVFILFVLLRMQIFSNIMIAGTIILFSLLGFRRIRISIFILAIFLLIVTVIPRDYIANSLIFISSYIDPSTENYFKFNDMATFIAAPYFDTATGLRAERYPMLFQAFIANPFLGDAADSKGDFFLFVSSGGHLHWMSLLTIWGIFGFLLYTYILYNLIKRVIGLFNDNFKFYYVLAVFAFIMLGLVKNIAGREPYIMLFVILPGLYFYPLINKLKNIELTPLIKNNIKVSNAK